MREFISPNRIDFLGGSLDLYPIYIFEFNTYTINAAINIYSKIKIKKSKDNKFYVISKDRNLKEKFDNINHLIKETKFKLLKEVIKNFKNTPPFILQAENEAFFGSGLGASSSLLISLIKAITYLNNIKLSPTEIINLASNIEARVIEIPTGKQDYVPALLQGFNIINFYDLGFKVKQIKENEFIKTLNNYIILVFTGKSHSSALTNWEIIKNYIEKDLKTREIIKELNKNAKNSINSILNKDIEKFCYFINLDWQLRKKLSKDISPIYIQKHIDKLYKFGASAIKLTGAGAGGSMLILAPPNKHDNIKNYLKNNNFYILNSKIIS